MIPIPVPSERKVGTRQVLPMETAPRNCYLNPVLDSYPLPVAPELRPANQNQNQSTPIPEPPGQETQERGRILEAIKASGKLPLSVKDPAMSAPLPSTILRFDYDYPPNYSGTDRFSFPCAGPFVPPVYAPMPVVPIQNPAVRLPKKELLWEYVTRMANESATTVGEELAATNPYEFISFPVRIMAIPAAFYKWFMDLFRKEDEEVFIAKKCNNNSAKTGSTRVSLRSRKVKTAATNTTPTCRQCPLPIRMIRRLFKATTEPIVWMPVAEFAVYESFEFIYNQL